MAETQTVWQVWWIGDPPDDMWIVATYATEALAQAHVARYEGQHRIEPAEVLTAVVNLIDWDSLHSD